jgi:hypothetical protein
MPATAINNASTLFFITCKHSSSTLAFAYPTTLPFPPFLATLPSTLCF